RVGEEAPSLGIRFKHISMPRMPTPWGGCLMNAGRMKIRRAPRAVIVAFLALAATGCTHALSQPMPDTKGQLALKVLNERPSNMSDMPISIGEVSANAAAAAERRRRGKQSRIFTWVDLELSLSYA